MPVMGLNPEDPTKVLPGLEACKSPNPSSLKNGCLGTAPSIGMDQFGLWCASDAVADLTGTSQPSTGPCLPIPIPWRTCLNAVSGSRILGSTSATNNNWLFVQGGREPVPDQ